MTLQGTHGLQGADKLRARLRAIGDTLVLMQAISDQGADDAKLLAQRFSKTRHLSQTIRRGIATPDRAETRAGGERNVGYAAYVERGTRPHIIRARNAKALAFPATAAGRTLAGRPTAAARRNSPGLGASKFRLAGGIKRVGAAGPSSGSMRFYRSVQHPGTK